MIGLLRTKLYLDNHFLASDSESSQTNGGCFGNGPLVLVIKLVLPRQPNIGSEQAITTTEYMQGKGIKRPNLLVW